MKPLRSLRLLATVARVRSRTTLVERCNAQNVLNMDPIQVSKDVDLDYKRYKMTNYDTKIRVNNFLEAVFSNDLVRSVQLLSKFRVKCSINKDSDAYVRNVEVYISCLSTLLMYASNKDTAATTFQNYSSLISEVFKVPNRISEERQEDIRSIHIMLVLVLLKTLQSVPANQKRTMAVLRAQILGFTDAHAIGTTEVLEIIKTKNPGLIDQYNFVWKTNVSFEQKGEEPHISIANYLNSDCTMSYKGLCNFVANESFDSSKFNQGAQLKYYELYEKLSEEDKARFMEEYLQFNRKKQLLVERYCHDLQSDPLSTTSNKNKVQKALALPWIAEIHRRICSELDRIFAGKSSHSELSKSFLPHSFLFQQVSKEVITSMVLRTLLRETLKASSSASVLRMTKEMTFMLKFHIKKTSNLAPIFNRADLFLSEEDSIALFSALLKLTIMCSKLESLGLLDTYSDNGSHFSDSMFAFDYEHTSEDTPGYKRAGIIRSHPFLLRNSALFDEILQGGATYLPMIHPPKPWQSPGSGGFLSDIAPLVRSSEPEMLNKYLVQTHLTGQLNSTFDSLNSLGELPWAINSDMEILFSKIISLPGGFLNIPPTRDSIAKIPKPKPPRRSQFATSEDYSAAYKAFQRSLKEYNENVKNLRSQRSYYDMNAMVANALNKKGEIFYFPYTLDFRGRVYPAVSVLSYQAEDLIRSLLVFWEAKPLGENGYNWLKYQLANLYCNRFMTMEESCEFVESNRSNIERSAQDSLNELWWTEADTPWQALALCKEISKVWTFQGNVQDYMCRIPIHMDGTCNGLQHYAALGANVEAAKSVNLLPSQRKNDVYLTVLGLVKQEVAKDCKAEDTCVRMLALEAQNYLSRKVVKRTVMTTVYGVTLFGAYRQIKETLPLADAGGSPISNHRLTEISSYLARQVLQAVSNLFGEARAIQNFLKQNTLRCISAVDCNIVKHFKKIDFFQKSYKPMMWTSLSGFPVIQNYRKKDTREIRTVLQSITMRRSTSKSPIDSRKQIGGIAPNFIHSLDALHLLMTNLAAKQNSIAFAAVHDSYWTHACDVETLNQLLRQEFVRLHSSDILLNFYNDLKHINRDAYQLVWVENQSNEEFVRELSYLRGKREGTKKRDWLNSRLNEELVNSDKAERIGDLTDIYNPELILKTKHNGEGIVYDSELNIRASKSLVSFFTHTPLLVKIRLSPVPEIGDLDIQEVLQSQYFFS